ncbi:MAG TPA: radical SAM family heme chaperone HemW [Chitinophagaceae bacterium]|nr:radical SAM family heme chaperone HemW [Chitinophagaceae bacterium]
MAGIYIHVPFCKQACHYCNFHFSTSMKLKNDFVEALLKEIRLQNQYLGNEIIETIYFGGGTPSLLDKTDLDQILQSLHLNFSIDPLAEVTLEANPDDINLQKLREWKDSGINRLSIGVQSFFEEDLKWMNRAHTADQSINCIKLSQDAGFENITIDLIYGSPGLTDEKWKANIFTAIELGIPHLSCYALTVEPKTALHHQIEKKIFQDVNADDQARQFSLLTDWANENCYEHYEISNFAKKGFRSRHNTSYWQQKKYLGLGPSAHSYNQISRQWNVANNAGYINSLREGKILFEIEKLTNEQRLNEYIMTSLRTVEGVNLSYTENHFGKKTMESLKERSKKYQENGLVTMNGENLKLTREGKFLADGIAADLFFDDV